MRFIARTIYVLLLSVLLHSIAIAQKSGDKPVHKKTEIAYPYILSLGDNSDLIDSLENQLDNVDDSTKIIYLCTLVKLYYEVNLNNSLKYGQQAFQLASELNDKEGLLFSRNFLIRIHRRLGNYSIVVEYLFDLIHDNLVSGDSLNLMLSYQIMGDTYLNMGKYEEAKRYLQLNLNMLKLTNDVGRISNTYNYYGMVLAETGQYDSALFYVNKALDELGDIKLQPSGTVGHSYRYNSLGRIYFLKKHYSEAIYYYTKSENLPKDHRSELGAIYTHYGLAEVFKSQKDYAQAILRAKRGLEISIQVGFRDYIKKGYLILSDLYKERQDYKNAFNAYQSYKLYYDSIYNDESLQYINILSLHHKLNVADIENKRIKEKANLLQLNNQLLQNEVFIRNLALSIGILFVVLISFLSYFLFIMIRKRNNTNRKLFLQKEELAHTLNMLKTTQDKLVQSKNLALLGSLIAGLSHEINNPLNYILGSSSLLNQHNILFQQMRDIMEKSLPKNSDEHLKLKEAFDLLPMLYNNIYQGSERIKSVMLSLNLLDPNIPIGKTKIHINELLTDVLNESKIPSSITIEKRLNDNHAYIIGLPEDIKLAFSHIIDNAVNSIVQKNVGNGVISISTQLRKDHLAITFRDNGSGIKNENNEKVFDPFYTTKPNAKSLGLTIAYGVIIKHQGSIKLESEENKWSEFTIVFPQQPLD